MSKADKKARQQRAKAAMRQRAADEWDEHMTLTPEQLKALLDHLDESLGTTPCNYSLDITRAWAAANGVDSSVGHFGGGCDCEVLANVDPQTQVDGWPRYLELYGKG